MGLDLYYIPECPPCRGVLIAAKNIGVELNLIVTDLANGEHMTPEFSKMSPQHLVPTMEDDGFFMYESRPIIQYLANAYGKDETQYPKEPKARFLVDHRLAFDYGTLHKRFSDAYYPFVFSGAPALDPELLAKLDEALGYLEGFLGQSVYAAGDNVTIADFSIAGTLATVECVGHDLSRFPLVEEYLTKLKMELDGYADLNQTGADQFGAKYQAALEKSSS